MKNILINVTYVTDEKYINKCYLRNRIFYSVLYIDEK